MDFIGLEFWRSLKINTEVLFNFATGSKLIVQDQAVSCVEIPPVRWGLGWSCLVLVSKKMGPLMKFEGYIKGIMFYPLRTMNF